MRGQATVHRQLEIGPNFGSLIDENWIVHLPRKLACCARVIEPVARMTLRNEYEGRSRRAQLGRLVRRSSRKAEEFERSRSRMIVGRRGANPARL